jgi:predicted alpha/beta-hydrolase family hydrolase
MYSPETLSINGYLDQAVPHTFFKQEDETRHLAILLPGAGYTAHMPLLYYPMRLLLEMGADVLRVEYAYMGRAEYEALSPAERVRWVFADVTAACRTGLEQRVYQQVTLVGKSLGTMAMGYLLTTEATLAQAQAIWLTPLLWNDLLRAQIRQAKPRSLFVTGTADPHYSAEHLAELQAATAGEAVVIEGANHSLEISGNLFASLQGMEQVIRALRGFLGSGPLAPGVV